MNYEETLSTLKTIQASYAPVPFLANPETEPRFVIDSDTREIIIPEEFKFLAVKMDHMSEKIYFEIPRYFDDEDLSTKICVVQYINTNGDAPIEAIVAAVDVDTESESGKIIFRWDVDNYLTRYAGMVSFAVRFYTISDDNRFTYSWNTLPATLPVLDTLDNTNDTVSQNYPTELVQWQFRMSELDRTISDKIAEATVTIDADAKAAQEARKGAEDAESRVNAIVSGNEAYTKQQSHDLFALALKGTAEAAKSITIYPDKGSNVVATIHGFTKQEGSGDASPANVRPIITLSGDNYFVPEMLVSGVSWDEETKTLTKPNVVGSYYDIFNGTTGNDAVVNSGIQLMPNTKYIFSAGPCDTATEIYSVDRSGVASRIATNISNNSIEAETGDTGRITIRMFAAGTQRASNITIRKKDSSELFLHTVTKGSVNEARFPKLTAPLCQGDKLVTKVKSGCDKKIVLDGSQTMVDTSDGQIQLLLSDAVTGYPLSDYLPNVTPFNNPEGLFILDGGKLRVKSTKIANSEAAKSYLATNPLTVFYRSNSYTEDKDIPVSLETHSRDIRLFDGVNKRLSYNSNNGSPYGDTSTLFPAKSATSLICNRAKIVKADVTYGNAYIANSTLTGFIMGLKGSEIASTEELNAELQRSPIEIVYELATPISYAHDPVDFIASPDEEGAWVITGEADGTVSAEYNKNITKALEDILTRVSALELHALGG